MFKLSISFILFFIFLRLVRNNVATEPEIFCNSSIASLNIASINKAL